MGILAQMWDRIANPFRAKQLNSFVSIGTGEAVFFARNYRAQSEEGYARNVYAHASIKLVAMAVSGVPWILTNTRSGEEIEDHPLLRLLEKPNPMMGRSEFFQWFISYFLIAGNAYWFSIAPDTGPNAAMPAELWLLRPDLVEPVPGGRMQPLKGFKLRSESGAEFPMIPGEMVNHFRSFNPLHQFMGLSPIQIAASSIVQGNESKRWNVSLLQNSARPTGAFVAEGNLKQDQKIRIREELEKKYESPLNAGRPLLLSGGMKWTQLSLSPGDMDWLEGQKLSAREVALIFGVPPELIGDSSNKTYSNYKEARRAFYEETILPTMVWIREELNAWLTPKFGDDLRLDFNTDQVSALQEDRAALFERMDKATFLTINEKRDATGFEPHADGDVILVPLSLVPLGLGMSAHEEDDEKKALDFNAEVASTHPSTGKAFGLQTEDQKLLYWKTFDRRRFMFLARVFTLIGRRLGADFNTVMKAFKSAGTAEAGFLAIAPTINDMTEKWFELFEAIYISVGDEFAKDVFKQIKSVNPPAEFKQDEPPLLGAFDDETFRDIWLSEIRGWVQANSTTRILGIQDSSIRQIQKVVSNGIAEGLSIPKISAGIADARKTAIDVRARLIARTEVISASNLGSVAAAKATGLPLRKEWVATPDERTREAHNDADGQIVDNLDSAFSVDGEALLFPGDTSLGATGTNIFNCRCTVVYQVADDPSETIDG